jgi:hypothetical protein
MRAKTESLIMKTTNHPGFIGRPGSLAGLAKEAIRLPIGSLARSQLEAAILERAQGPGEIRWAIRKEKVQPAAPANRFGRRLSLSDARTTFASDAEQRAYWVNLITKNQPLQK